MNALNVNGMIADPNSAAPEPRNERPENPLPAIQQAVAARDGQTHWAARPLTERLTIVRRIRRLIAKNATELAYAVQTSRKGPLAEALASEVLPLADACRFLELQAGHILRPRRISLNGRPFWLMGVCAEMRREPFGLVLVIGPYNYPLFIPGVHALQSLAAGNSVLLKPGLGGGLALRVFRRICVEAGLPPQLLHILPESLEAAERAIEAGVDKVVFTGSAQTGEKVLAQLARRLVPATMELSGCDAAFIRSDADLDLAAKALRFALVWNGGATCIAPRRVFAAAEIAGELERRLVASIAEMPPRPGGWQLNSSAAALVRDAMDHGARLVMGAASQELCATPTVVADARVEMPLLREEVFAPMLALVSVRDEDEALRAAASCPFALGATVFGEEPAADAFAKRVCAGVVVINDVIVPTADPRLPFGGRKRSGFGVTRGAEGLLELTTMKVIAARRGKALWHLEEPQFSDDELIQHYIRAVHGDSWVRRGAAWLSLTIHLLKKLWGGSMSQEKK